MGGSVWAGLRLLAGSPYLLGIALLLPWFWFQGRASLATRVPQLHLLRGLAGLGAMYCFYYAVARMHLGEAMLLKMTAPLFIPFVALFWLREKLSGRVLLALAIGFGGVTLVISPDLRQFDPVALIALLGLAAVHSWLAASPYPQLGVSIALLVSGTIGLWLGRRGKGSTLGILQDFQLMMIGPAWLLSLIYKRFRVPF